MSFSSHWKRSDIEANWPSHLVNDLSAYVRLSDVPTCHLTTPQATLSDCRVLRMHQAAAAFPISTFNSDWQVTNVPRTIDRGLR